MVNRNERPRGGWRDEACAIRGRSARGWNRTTQGRRRASGQALVERTDVDLRPRRWRLPRSKRWRRELGLVSQHTLAPRSRRDMAHLCDARGRTRALRRSRMRSHLVATRNWRMRRRATRVRSLLVRHRFRLPTDPTSPFSKACLEPERFSFRKRMPNPKRFPFRPRVRNRSKGDSSGFQPGRALFFQTTDALAHSRTSLEAVLLMPSEMCHERLHVAARAARHEHCCGRQALRGGTTVRLVLVQMGRSSSGTDRVGVDPSLSEDTTTWIPGF